MKIRIVLSLLLFLFFGVQTQAQQCATDEMLQEYFDQNPGEYERFMAQQRGLADGSLLKGIKKNKSATYTIPVVVHVIHYNGDGNISREQIEDGIRVLNEDFQKLNADTSDIRNLFKSIAADSEVQFRLANKAEDSSCTTGIVRINSFLTYDNRNEVKALSHWNSNNYLNVWLVNTIRSGSGLGTTLGYAQFPGSPDLSTYGLVVRHDQWGTIGTATSDGRTATHEVGHCFNLFHPFSSGCGFNCHQTGDFVCDTPPVSGQNFGCDTTTNTCTNDWRGGVTGNTNPYSTNVEDQLENYMSYNDCQNMFTEGQKTRMHNALGFYSQLVNLTKNSNLKATGTEDGQVTQLCPPVAEMYLAEQYVCVGDSFSFRDDSYGDSIVDYKWIFPGASPYTSTDARPTVAYDTAGVHDVTLIVSNSAGSDTLLIRDIIVASGASDIVTAFNYTESFENARTIGTDWKVYNPSGNIKWSRAREAAPSAGTYSAYLKNFQNVEGEEDYLTSPIFDMTTVTNPKIEFKVAHKDRTGAENEVLVCEASTDCGQSWSTLRLLTKRNFNSGTDANDYTPAAADWRSISLNLTTAQKNSTSFRFRFNFTSLEGNNLYIDDFKITGPSSTVGLGSENRRRFDFNVFPNPASREVISVNLSMDESTEDARIYLTDIMGKRVQTIYRGSLSEQEYTFQLDATNLSSGIYFVSLESSKGRVTKKLVIS